jgi:hypothetical protein
MLAPTTVLREIHHQNKVLHTTLHTIDLEQQFTDRVIMRLERRLVTTRIIAISTLRQFTILERRFLMPILIRLVLTQHITVTRRLQERLPLVRTRLRITRHTLVVLLEPQTQERLEMQEQLETLVRLE